MTAADADYQRPSIALIGYRGCGKSAVGRELAALLGGSLVDTDEVVAANAGRGIRAIFAEEGEDGFRRWERNAVARVVASPPAVIAVGGGAVLDDRNVEALKTVAALVWLKAPVEVLWRRIAEDPSTADSRPPLTDRPGIEEVRQMLAARHPYYERAADLAIETPDKKPRDIALEIAGHLRGDSPP